MALDQITLKRIATLHPKVRKQALEMYTYANEKLLGKGVRLRFAYTTRSFEEQEELYAQGRTKLFDNKGKRLGKVTNAKAGQSIHNFSLAFDIVLLLDKNNDGVFESASWDTKADNDKNGKSDWMEVTNYFKSQGWKWGGDFKSIVDPPHFEYTFGHTWKTLQDKIKNKQYTTEVIDSVTYKYVNL